MPITGHLYSGICPYALYRSHLYSRICLCAHHRSHLYSGVWQYALHRSHVYSGICLCVQHRSTCTVGSVYMSNTGQVRGCPGHALFPMYKEHLGQLPWSRCYYMPAPAYSDSNMFCICRKQGSTQHHKTFLSFLL